MSSKPTGPDRGGVAGPEQSVFIAISCQSVTASALAAFDQPSAPRRPAATHLFQFQRVVMTCISLLPLWVERLRFTLRHDGTTARHGMEGGARRRKEASNARICVPGAGHITAALGTADERSRQPARTVA